MKKNVLKSLLIMAALIGFMLPSSAADNQQLPIDTAVRYGVLPNGLTYYIRHNSEPNHRADFYIAQKVGSILEEDNQRGLAHFLEHMAFNGTKHFPGKAMLDYLQNNGMRFGYDINAGTGFDQTIYNVKNVPTDRQGVLDSALLVLHDWSCAITLDPQEIDKERGVIREEWRTRGDAQWRMWDKVIPILFHGSKYANRMPIGTMDVVMNFKPKELQDYYHRWYRPDQQGIIIVGDFDAAKMEQKVKEMFTPNKMPANAQVREEFPVPDHQGIDYALCTDPESSNTMVYLFFQHQQVPQAERNTLSNMKRDIVNELCQSMISQRLGELSQKPDCPFAYAGVSDGNFFISHTKDAFMMLALAKEGKGLESFESMLTEARRIDQHGFTPGELSRAKDEYMSELQNQYNERNKRKNSRYISEYVNHFISGGYIPGIDYELQKTKELLPTITLDMVNNFVSQYISENNVSMMLTGPEKQGLTYPDSTAIKADFDKIIKSDVAAYVDEVSDKPLLSKEPTSGKIVKETYEKDINVTTLKLSNGATVYLKPTNFKNDEILMDAISLGGEWAYKGQNAIDLKVLDGVVGVSALGTFSQMSLTKRLSGKIASANFSLNDPTESISGRSSKKDLETMLQLNYLLFTDVRKDEQAFKAYQSSMKSRLSLAKNNPNNVFGDSIMVTLFHHNPLYKDLTVEEVDKINYDDCMKLVKERLGNAGDFSFSFVGNFSVDSIRPLIEKYIASLPDNGVREKTSYIVGRQKGTINNLFDRPMQIQQTSVYSTICGDLKYNLRNDFMLDLLEQLMDIVYTRTIREEESGTYGVSTGASISKYSNTWHFTYEFNTNDAQKDRLIKRADEELFKVMKDGAQAEDFQKVKEATVKQYENNLRENSYWMDILNNRGIGIDTYTGFKKMLDDLTLADFNKFVKTLNNGNNHITVVMNGVTKK